MKKILFPVLMFPVLMFIPQHKKIRIFMAGDSTMSVKDSSAYPETGWGMPFVYFWDTTVQIVNLAKNGRSTKSFIEEGLWRKIYDNAVPGDYVFIQFGHNDEVQTKKASTTESEFKANLIRMVTETKQKQSFPVLITPVARRKFNSAGKVEGTHEVYAQIVRDVAIAQKVPLIDLDKKAQALYQKLGAESSKLLFVQLQPGENPNYPNGKEDNTHFNELGARLVAEMVLQDIGIQMPELAARIVKRK